MHIASTCSTTVESLNFIASAVLSNGGAIHPSLTVHHCNAQLWMTCDTDESNDPLLLVPDSLFIPVSQRDWRSTSGTLIYTGNTGSLTAVQKQVLDAMVGIYNATDKMTCIAERLPCQLLPTDPALLEWLKTSNSNFSIPSENASQLFIGTRLHSKGIAQDEDDSTGYLMPLIDLLNHHPYGPDYARTPAGDWQIPVCHPRPDSNECFVRYNKSDSLSLAIWHGYFESRTRHCAVLDSSLYHPRTGNIRIIRCNTGHSKLNPPRLIPNEPVLTLQDLVLEQQQLPALRTLLGLAVRSKQRDMNQVEAEAIAATLIHQLVADNIQKYSMLLNLCQTDRNHKPLRTLFGQVAAHQIELLNSLKLG